MNKLSDDSSSLEKPSDVNSADQNSEFHATFVKRFSEATAIAADLRFPTSKFSITTLFGPSGCGKTTVLCCLAGLDRPTQGSIQFGDEIWFDSTTTRFLTPQQRDIGLLFQDYALFPHLTVAQNISFGLNRLPRRQRDERVTSMLNAFDLQGLGHRFPHQISGGQQQRVSLARVLARRPRLLLLDEPLSALDATLRETLRIELRRQLSAFQIPVILVTHDRLEAISLSDRIVIMEAGHVLQSGSVSEVIAQPKDLTVARIVGVETVLTGSIVAIEQGLATIQIGSTTLLAIAPDRPAKAVHVCIRGEDVAIQLGQTGTSSVRNHLPGTIKSLLREGPLVRVSLDCGFELTALITRPACDELNLQPGSAITASIKAPAIHLIPLD